MRIVGGAYRGRPIVAPKGHSTRPTADRTRQAIFDVLEHAGWSRGLAGVRVVDLFAGSGAFGLEALSRGAEGCLFVDQAPVSRAAVEANLAAFAARDRATVRLLDTSRLPSRPPRHAEVSLAFVDPPYHTDTREPSARAARVWEMACGRGGRRRRAGGGRGRSSARSVMGGSLCSTVGGGAGGLHPLASASPAAATSPRLRRFGRDIKHGDRRARAHQDHRRPRNGWL